MFLTILLSAIHLINSPLAADSSIETLRQHQLETVEGRTAFLTQKMVAYTKAADQLNLEIQDLSCKIKTLSSQNDEEEIIARTQEMIQKMDHLSRMMPVLEMALSIDEDFLQIEALSSQQDPYSPSQQELVDRVAALCRMIDEEI